MTLPTNTLLTRGRCFVIAEVGQAHDGSLGSAHAYIDAIARTGADAVKFQTHYADAESSSQEPFRVKFSRQDPTRFDYWKRLEFTSEQWGELGRHAVERGLVFLSSPFSLKAVEVLNEIGVPAWKIASGEISNALMLDRIAATGKGVIFSSGMSPLEELRGAVARVRGKVAEIAVLQCTTAYPCPPERIGLNMINVFRDELDVFAGLSDHSGTIFPSLAGATLGMEVLELHVTFSRACFGPDVLASITIEELAELVRGIRFIETMRANPVTKDAPSEGTDELRRMFMRGLVAAVEMSAGEVLTLDHIDTRKPMAGIPAARYQEILGRTVNRSIKAGEFLQFADIDGLRP